jgi:ATP dependent DNA ligase domain
MLLRSRWAAPSGFVEPCLPSPADRPPSAPGWIHEIKHDGFRVIARKDGDRVKLYSRNGNDLTRRFLLYSSSNSKRRNEDRHSARRLPTPSHHLAAGCASDRGQPAPATV